MVVVSIHYRVDALRKAAIHDVESKVSEFVAYQRTGYTER